MPFCPQCGYEYEEGVTLCPDCDKTLVAEPPDDPQPTTAGWPPAEDIEGGAEMDEMNEEALVAVYESTDEALSDALLATLEDANIPVMEEFDRAPLGDGLDLGVLHGPYSRLMVPESYEERARKIVADYLEAYEHGDLALTEDEEDEPTTNGGIPDDLGDDEEE